MGRRCAIHSLFVLASRPFVGRNGVTNCRGERLHYRPRTYVYERSKKPTKGGEGGLKDRTRTQAWASKERGYQFLRTRGTGQLRRAYARTLTKDVTCKYRQIEPNKDACGRAVVKRNRIVFDLLPMFLLPATSKGNSGFQIKRTFHGARRDFVPFVNTQA